MITASDHEVSAVFIGNEGNDVLTGGEQNDQLIGGAGADTLDGGDGNDVLDGGAGNDVYVASNGDDIIITGGGTDRLNISAGYTLSGMELILRRVLSRLHSMMVQMIIRFQSRAMTRNHFQLSEFIQVQLTFQDFSLAVTYTASTNTFSATGDVLTLVAGTSGSEVLAGGDADDRIYGGTRATTEYSAMPVTT